MNKVVSVEIARQVFWVEEGAHEMLQTYLGKIRKQLDGDACATDIYMDIELRVAELLFEPLGDSRKAIMAEQIASVIAQVGYIEQDDLELSAHKQTVPAAGDRILAGVCAELAVRLRWPAVVLRIIFLGLACLFGLGIVLYLVLWLALAGRRNRTAASAAQALRQSSGSETAGGGSLGTLQRVIFFPIRLAGWVVIALGRHLSKRKSGYRILLKNLSAAVLLVAVLIFCSGLFEFNQQRYFSTPINILLSVAALYLVILVLAIFVREYYLARPLGRINRKLKLGGLVPLTVLVTASLVLNYMHGAHMSEVVEKHFVVEGGQLHLVINDPWPADGRAQPVELQIQTHPSDAQLVRLKVAYSSDGVSEESAARNIRSINYFYTFENNTLELNKFWTLQPRALRRGQKVRVIMEVPQNMLVESSVPLELMGMERPYRYTTGNSLDQGQNYLVKGAYLHEFDAAFRQRVSANEMAVLRAKFCEAFFISESWRCMTNLQVSVAKNSRFDPAFRKDMPAVDALRQYLLPGRTLQLNDLLAMNVQVRKLSSNYLVLVQLPSYLEQLVDVKTQRVIDEKSAGPTPG